MESSCQKSMRSSERKQSVQFWWGPGALAPVRAIGGGKGVWVPFPPDSQNGTSAVRLPTSEWRVVQDRFAGARFSRLLHGGATQGFLTVFRCTRLNLAHVEPAADL